MRKMFSLLFVLSVSFTLTNGQVKNLHHAETIVVGSWEATQKYALLSDLTKTNLVIKDDHTAQIIPAKMLDGRRSPITAHWTIEKEGNEYFLKLSSEEGLRMQKWVYHLDAGSLVQAGTTTKYLKLDNC